MTTSLLSGICLLWMEFLLTCSKPATWRCAALIRRPCGADRRCCWHDRSDDWWMSTCLLLPPTMTILFYASAWLTGRGIVFSSCLCIHLLPNVWPQFFKRLTLLWPNGASYSYSYYGTLIGNPTPGIQWYKFRPPGVTPNWGMGPPWGAFCQITLTSCLKTNRFQCPLAQVVHTAVI